MREKHGGIEYPADGADIDISIIMVLRRGLEPLRLILHLKYCYKLININILNVIEHV